MSSIDPRSVRRSTGRRQVARAVWYTGPGRVELRPAPLNPPGPGEALVRTLFSGISRGTERLVSSGAIPKSEWEAMRCPMQEGAFTFPVKYGYCAVGVVEEGPAELMGRTVFCLHPHQERFVVPASALVAVPDSVPPRRATLTANMETALNAHWDAGTGPGDRIIVVGAGIVGLMIASVAARLPGEDVTVVDVDPARRAIVESLGARFAMSAEIHPAAGAEPADIVFHTSVSAAGLNAAIAAAGVEGTIVELSWYGDKHVAVELGGGFHSRRLKLISSQVGQVSPSRRPRWSYARRMGAALRLLDDPALDALVAEEIAFADAAKRLPELLAPGAGGLAPVIRYG